MNVGDCLKKLRASDNGLLYEDAYLQIGVKSQWRGRQGRVMFYLGNKTDADLSGLRLSVSPPAGLHARLAPAPAIVGAKKQVQVLLELAAERGYAELPTLALAYRATASVPGGRSLVDFETTLELPYGCHKFLEPWSVSAPEAFFAKWHELARDGAQDVKVVTVAPAVAAEGLRAIEAALSAVRMGAQPGLDPNANNAVAGSRCAYSSSPGGGEEFALARVESDANNRAVFRITIAGSDRGTVEGVRAALFSQIL